MKRKFLVILCLFMVLNFITSCNTKDHNDSININIVNDYAPYTVFVIGGYDCCSIGEANYEPYFLFEEFENEIEIESLLSSKKTFKINGEKYKIKYNHSVYDAYWESNVDVYMCATESEVEITVGFDAKSEQAVFFDVSEEFYDIYEGITEKSYNDRVDIGSDFLKKNINDFDSYKLSVNEYTEKEIIIKLNKKSDKMVVGDSAHVRIDKYGNIVGFNITSAGAMKDAKFPDGEEMEIIKNNIEAKLYDIYTPVNNRFNIDNIQYELSDTFFFRFCDGRYGIRYDCDVFLPLAESPDQTQHDSCVLLVVL